MVFMPTALSDANVAALLTNDPPVFPSMAITKAGGTQGAAYTGTLSGSATDADAGDTLTYSKYSGPAWLTVAANGTLAGTPTSQDEKLQEFMVRATDSRGATSTACSTSPCQLSMDQTRGQMRLPVDPGAIQ